TGTELGSQVRFPAFSIERDFAWSAAHPIVDAYRAYKAMPYDAPTRDMATVLYAVRQKENYFKLSGPGTIAVADDGSTKFTASPDGKHQYLVFDPGQKEHLLKTYTEIASAKPVPRRPRFPRQNQDQEKKEVEKKPEPAKSLER